jgi:hypothetical protein
LIQQNIRKLRVELPPLRVVTRKLVDVPVYTAAEYAERLAEFRARTEAIAAYCERVGAQAVLVIPPCNDADFEPNRSFLPPRTTQAERDGFTQEFQAARQAEAADPDAGIVAYRDLLERQPGFAEAHYRLARLLETAGRTDEANAHYVAARDWDGLPMRCDSEFQDAYREAAARHPGVILIDGPAVLRGMDPRGVVGDNCFIDGFHPSLNGYTGLAQAILQGLYARRAFGWPEKSPAPVVTPAECAAQFAIDAKKWVEVCNYAAWFYGKTAFARFDPSQRLAKNSRYLEASRLVASGTSPEAIGVQGIGTRLFVNGH